MKMDTIQTSLDKNKSVVSENQIKHLNVDIEREEKLLPTLDVVSTIDAYEQYLKEKDATNKYRLVFTIHPYCSNVLFNRISEMILNEGSDNAKLIFTEEEYSANTSSMTGTYCAMKYGYQDTSSSGCTIPSFNTSKHFLTRDTGYSCDSFNNPVKYHCGLDIFNNHILRKKEFVTINLPKADEVAETRQFYNTIFDVVRDPFGNIESGLTNVTTVSSNQFHLYNRDSIYGFINGINKNLKEENGWFGFINQAQLKIKNNTTVRFSPFIPGIIDQPVQPITPIEGGVRSVRRGIGDARPSSFSVVTNKTFPTINRVINDEDECAFIDLYPGKKEYTFVPRINESRNRLEKNWEYCLTYPYENVYDNYLLYESGIIENGHKNDLSSLSGILCECVDFGNFGYDSNFGITNRPLTILFKTHIKHNFHSGDRLRICVRYGETENIGTNNEIDIFSQIIFSNLASVTTIGNNGYDNQYYFSIAFDDVENEFIKLKKVNDISSIHFRVEKVVNDKPCKYYIRKFKKIPNFKNTGIDLNVSAVTINLINDALDNNDFASSINKLGFSKTIYGDDIVQIVYNDDIDVTGLRDNLGRALSEIYLTVVKTNYGHDKWYSTNPDYGNRNVEYSHCFGKITSGFDLPVDSNHKEECNIHTQHNIEINNWKQTTLPPLPGELPTSSNALESGITIDGLDDDNYDFYGDIVELDENTLTETVLEVVQHRFNTAQREYTTSNINDNIFSALTVDYILMDDFEYGVFATGNTANILCGYCVNIAPEGYYYQPHYKIKLHEYDSTVHEGYHTQVYYDYEVYLEEYYGALEGGRPNDNFTILTDRNYFFNVTDEIWLVNKINNSKMIGVVTSVSGTTDFAEVIGNDFRLISFTIPQAITDLREYKLFKPNKLKPNLAYELNDGTGKYIWRDFIPSSKIMRNSDIYDSVFTNGAIYIHKDINFYLKRQDPFGDYGLNPNNQNNKDFGITGCETATYSDLEVNGNWKDVSYGDYSEPDANNNC